MLFIDSPNSYVMQKWTDTEILEQSRRHLARWWYWVLYWGVMPWTSSNYYWTVYVASISIIGELPLPLILNLCDLSVTICIVVIFHGSLFICNHHNLSQSAGWPGPISTKAAEKWISPKQDWFFLHLNTSWPIQVNEYNSTPFSPGEGVKQGVIVLGFIFPCFSVCFRGKKIF